MNETQVLTTDRPDGSALRIMRQTEKVKDLWWAAYKNTKDAHLKFLAVGPHTKFKEVPSVMPDIDGEKNADYAFLGWVDLAVGNIHLP